MSSIIDVKKILTEYTEEIQEEIKKAAEDVAIDGSKKLQNVSFPYTVRSGDYNKGWTYEIKTGATYVHARIKNKKAPGLTHLLEFGHVAKNQFGQWGYVKSYPHIKKIEEYCIKKYEQDVENAIKKAGK